MLLSKKVKIEVNEQDAEALEFMQAKCRGLYNWWVMRLKSGERWNLERAKKSLRESKQYDPELRFVYGKLLAEVYFRLDGAMQAFCSSHFAILPCTWKYKATPSSSRPAEVPTGDRNAMRISWRA